MGGGAVKRGDDQVVMHHLPCDERIGQALVEGVEAGIGGWVERVVQMCAVPVPRSDRLEMVLAAVDVVHGELTRGGRIVGRGVAEARSEERRVGKECRSRWSPYH